MIFDFDRRIRLCAGVIAFSAGLAAPALADHVTTADTRSLQEPRPIELGTSGGSRTFLRVKNLLYCYTGTLGSLVENGGVTFILSNNHVLAKENGNLDYGDPVANDTIIQPGLLDEGTCALDSGNPANGVADLGDYVTILFGKGRNKPLNTVDGAIAAVRSGQVEPSGSIIGIGTIGGETDAALGMAVQKTGRTTAHTFGTVMAVGVTIDVGYESGNARFQDQIRIRRPCDDAGFSDAGDSGSLVATAPAPGTAPSAVGLLFAGGGSDTFANPIGAVLDSMGVTMVTGPDDGDNGGAMLADWQAIKDACPTGDGGGGGGNGGGGGGPPGGTPPGLSGAKDAAVRHSNEIFALPDVVGHGIGANANGDAVVEIYVAGKARRAVGRGYPTQIEGFPVRVIETGPIKAY